jgi:predicted nucleotidyltransferase
LDAGKSFAAARGAALESALGVMDCGLTTLPNNGLGMEYCKALALLDWPMQVFTTHRKPGGASATKIRKALTGITNAADFEKSDMPAYVYEILREAVEQNEIVCIDAFSDVFRYLLCKGENGNNTTDNALLFNEGLKNRFRRFAPKHPRLTGLLTAVKTKRYTFTRLQRAAMCTVLTIFPPAGYPQYIRVLGFRKDSAHLVGELTRRARLPVLTGKADLDKHMNPMLAKELEAGDIYQLAYKNGQYRNERSQPIVRV